MECNNPSVFTGKFEVGETLTLVFRVIEPFCFQDLKINNQNCQPYISYLLSRHILELN